MVCESEGLVQRFTESNTHKQTKSQQIPKSVTLKKIDFLRIKSKPLPTKIKQIPVCVSRGKVRLDHHRHSHVDETC